MDFYKVKSLVIVKGQKYDNNSSEGIFKRQVLTAINKDLWGLSKYSIQGKTITYQELADEFT